MMMFRLLLLLCHAMVTIGFISICSSVNYDHHHLTLSGDDDQACDEDTIITLPLDISCDVRSTARDLWGRGTLTEVLPLAKLEARSQEIAQIIANK